MADIGVHMAALRRVEAPRVYSEIVSQFQTLVESGELHAGDRLPAERQLAAKFGVSRSAVREAMTALEVLGIVRVRPGVGIFIESSGAEENDHVAQEVAEMISETGTLEILEARGLCEPGAARLAAQRRTATDLADMQRHIARMEEDLRNGGAGWEADWGFHQAIAAATQNPLIVSMIDHLGQRMGNQLWALMRARNLGTEGRAHRYLADHIEILEAIERGQGDSAFRAMHRHIRLIQSDLETDETLAGESLSVE